MKRPANQILAATLLLAVLSTFSCKKDAATSKSNLLTSGSWTLRTIEYQKTDGTWENYPNPTVYTVTFKDDHTVTSVTGTQVSVKSWSINDDFSQLTIVGTSGSGTAATVTQLSSSTLQLSKPYVIANYLAERDTYTH